MGTAHIKKRKQLQEAAELWKAKQIWELEARIVIESSMLRSYRSELNWMKRLEGEDLAMHYGLEPSLDWERAS